MPKSYRIEEDREIFKMQMRKNEADTGKTS
jgi:hypothetical protein